MKLREKMKRFWTLDVHNHAGFTLVELIIVIAILAILSTGAIAGYGVYVEQANMTADEALIAEIQNALTLHYYNSNAEGSGYVVLTAEGQICVADAFGTSAMDAAFGDGWEERLALKYDGWSVSAEMLDLAKKDLAYSGSVNDSSYITNVGTKELLNDVQSCVSALQGLVGSMYGSDDLSDFVDTLSPEYKAVLEDAGYSADEKWKDVDSTVLTNAIVFGLASQYTGDGGTNIAEQFYNSDDLLIGVEINQNTGISELAAWYASAEAYVAWAKDPGLNQSFSKVEQYLAKPEAITNPAEVRTKMLELQTDIIAFATQTDKANEMPNMAYFTALNSDGKSQAQLDGESYVNLMRTVNGLSSDYANKDSLSSNTLFVDGAVLDQMNSYVAAAALAKVLPDELLAKLTNTGSAWVAVLISQGEVQVLPAM